MAGNEVDLKRKADVEVKVNHARVTELKVHATGSEELLEHIAMQVRDAESKYLLLHDENQTLGQQSVTGA